MDLITSIGLVVPAGLNAYIPLITVAIAQRLGLMELRTPFDLLGTWWALALIAVLLVVEVVADKVPAVDHVNDAIQTILRPAAGGILFFATTPVASEVDPALLVFAGIVLAGGVHAAKAATRPVVNTATGGAAAPLVSFVEDVTAAIMSVVAVLIPILVVFMLAGLSYMLWRFSKKFRGRDKPSVPPESAPG